jgi:hypothetical protein
VRNFDNVGIAPVQVADQIHARQDDLHFKPTIEVLRVDFSRMAFDRALRDGKAEASTTRVPIAGLIHSLCKPAPSMYWSSIT